jgi:hypothetical protein
MDSPQPRRCCGDIESDSRASVALNNIGVSLLARGSYGFALETFRDSIAVLERAHGLDHQVSSLETSSLTVRDMLDLAEKRLAASFNPTWTSYPNVSNIRVNPISYDGVVFHGVTDANSSLTSFFPAWIECAASKLSFENELPESGSFDEDFRLALILYNYALANLCLIQAVSSDPAGRVTLNRCVKRLQEKALWVLELVNGTLDVLSAWTAMSLWREDSRLTLSWLSLAYTASAAMQVSNHLEVEETTSRVSLAVDASRRWSAAIADLVDGPRTHESRDLDSDPSSFKQLHVCAFVQKAPAA